MSALERGYLYMAVGEAVQGREALQDALPHVSPEVATEVISLLDLLDRLEGETLAAFMRSVVLAHRGRTVGALSELEVAIDVVPRDGRPSLLAMGARIADKGGCRTRRPTSESGSSASTRTLRRYRKPHSSSRVSRERRPGA